MLIERDKRKSGTMKLGAINHYALFFLDPDGIKLELTHIPNWPTHSKE